MTPSEPLPENIPLGREVAYPRHYAPGLLCPIPRADTRAALGLDPAAPPFTGHDRWHLYELSWLDAHGLPRVATATLHVPADSPQLIESKSLKLYLNSLNATRFDTADHLRDTLTRDLAATAGAPVQLRFGLPPLADLPGTSIDEQPLAPARYGPPDAALLACDPKVIVEETLGSRLLKSNCPVTGQPDWASVSVHYRGPRHDRRALLAYLVSYRDHAEFHEQCVERIYRDLRERCAPQWLSVEARYTRRGGLDINPWRASPGVPAPPAIREERQ
jgi:7-cyano-7-deazaguanine reductase